MKLEDVEHARAMTIKRGKVISIIDKLDKANVVSSEHLDIFTQSENGNPRNRVSAYDIDEILDIGAIEFSEGIIAFIKGKADQQLKSIEKELKEMGVTI